MLTTTFHFYEDTFSRLSDALTTYVGDVSANVIGAISGVAYTMLMIYMMLWGWSMLRGMISEPITDGVSRLVRLVVVVAIALNLGQYNTFLANFLWNAPDALASYVASGYSSESSNAQFLDSLMSQIYNLGVAYWTKANSSGSLVPDLGLMSVALLTWAAGVAATGRAAFLLALSKMALAIILGIGPIFVLLLIFEGTKRFFEAWLGQALNYVFLVVLTAGGIKLIMTIIQAYIGAANAAGVGADPTVDQAIPAIVLCLIGALVMTQLPSIASALGGGVAISTLGAVGWAYGRTKGTVAAVRPTHLRFQMNRLRSDVRIAGNAARSAGGAPMALYRKVTGGSRSRATST